MHTRTRREHRKLEILSRRVASKFLARARVCISPAPQSPSPKLETTRSLDTQGQLVGVTGFSGQSASGISNASGTRSVRVNAQRLSLSCC